MTVASNVRYGQGFVAFLQVIEISYDGLSLRGAFYVLYSAGF